MIACSIPVSLNIGVSELKIASYPKPRQRTCWSFGGLLSNIYISDTAKCFAPSFSSLFNQASLRKDAACHPDDCHHANTVSRFRSAEPP